MGVQMRMYAVHSEYEVVVFKESAAAAKGGLGVLPHEILKKILFYVASGAI